MAMTVVDGLTTAAFAVFCLIAILAFVELKQRDAERRARSMFTGNRCAGSPVPPPTRGAAVDPALRDAPYPRTPARPAPFDGDAA